MSCTGRHFVTNIEKLEETRKIKQRGSKVQAWSKFWNQQVL